MPFVSEKQRRYLWANEPAVAKKFAHDPFKAPTPPKKKKIASKPETRKGY